MFPCDVTIFRFVVPFNALYHSQQIFSQHVGTFPLVESVLSTEEKGVLLSDTTQCLPRGLNQRLLASRSHVVQSVIVSLPKSNDYVYICMFVNIKIQIFGWHIQ